MQGFVCVAQNDDFPDSRSKKDNFSKIREKEIRNDLSTFTIAGIVESMGKLPLKSIPVKNYSNNFMEFEGNSVKVIIRSGIFEPAKHKLAYYDEKYLVRIDNKPYYGNYGKIPGRTIESVTVIIDKDTIAIPPVAFSDLYNPTFLQKDASGALKSFNGVYLSPASRAVYIYMLNKEIKGSYEVTWVIQDKKYLRRVVDFGLLE
jgi:hypothetical protein